MTDSGRGENINQTKPRQDMPEMKNNMNICLLRANS